MTDLDTPTLRSEHDRLRQIVTDAGRSTRWASEAIHLAQAALSHYDGRKLSRPADYHAFFREVEVRRYSECRDVAAAIIVFDAISRHSALVRQLIDSRAITIDEAHRQLGIRGTVVDL